jgi:hypothetical protein
MQRVERRGSVVAREISVYAGIESGSCSNEPRRDKISSRIDDEGLNLS